MLQTMTIKHQEVASKRYAAPKRPLKSAVPRRCKVSCHGSTQLRDYLTHYQIPHQAFADSIGVTRPMVGMLLGGSAPSLRVAVWIETITGIPCRDWVDEVVL